MKNSRNGNNKKGQIIMKSFKVGDEVTIKAKISGLKRYTKGVITHIDGAYFLVRPKGRKKGEEVELYYNEMEK